MAKILIATLYRANAVLLATARLGADKLILLVDKNPVDEQQEESLKLIRDLLGGKKDVEEDSLYELVRGLLGSKTVEIEVVKTEVYEIVEIAKKCVEIIDAQAKDDVLYANVTAGRKTKAFGLLYAAYARAERIKKIAYNPEEDLKAVIYLPKLKFRLTESEKSILEVIEKGEFQTLADLAKKVKLSNAMFYRSANELEEWGYIEMIDGVKITDAGRIARL